MKAIYNPSEEKVSIQLAGVVKTVEAGETEIVSDEFAAEWVKIHCFLQEQEVVVEEEKPVVDEEKEAKAKAKAEKAAEAAEKKAAKEAEEKAKEESKKVNEK